MQTQTVPCDLAVTAPPGSLASRGQTLVPSVDSVWILFLFNIKTQSDA